MSRRRRYRKGRDKAEEQFFGLSYPMARSLAFRLLSGPALKVFIEVRTRFNGGNNGDLSLSLDEAAQLLGIGKGTAQRAFSELEDKGFLRLVQRGQWIGRQATTWRTTDKGCKGELPTNDWRAWRPQRRPPDVRPETEPRSRTEKAIPTQIQKEGRMSTCVCLWCQGRFKPRSDGGRPQRYCSPACRRSFDGAARSWVRQAVDDGSLTLPDLQKASPATRALVTAQSRLVGLPGGAHERIASPRPPQRVAARTSIFGSIEFSCGRYVGRNVAPSVLRWTENHSPGAVAVPSGCSIGAVAVHEIGSRSTSEPVRPVSPQFIGAVAVRLYNHSLCTARLAGRDAIRSGGDDNANAGSNGFQTPKRGQK